MIDMCVCCNYSASLTAIEIIKRSIVQSLYMVFVNSIHNLYKALQYIDPKRSPVRHVCVVTNRFIILDWGIPTSSKPDLSVFCAVYSK